MIEVTGGGGAAGGSSGSSEAAVRTALEDYMARLPEPLNMVEVQPVTLVESLDQLLLHDRQKILCSNVQEGKVLVKCHSSCFKLAPLHWS